MYVLQLINVRMNHLIKMVMTLAWAEWMYNSEGVQEGVAMMPSWDLVAKLTMELTTQL